MGIFYFSDETLIIGILVTCAYLYVETMRLLLTLFTIILQLWLQGCRPTAVTASMIFHIKPIDSSIVHYNSSNSYTLGELTKICCTTFMNNTVLMMMMPGVHSAPINDDLVVVKLKSFDITSYSESERTFIHNLTLTCSNSQSIDISHIILNCCRLIFTNTIITTLTNVSIINSEVKVTNSISFGQKHHQFFYVWDSIIQNSPVELIDIGEANISRVLFVNGSKKLVTAKGVSKLSIAETYIKDNILSSDSPTICGLCIGNTDTISISNLTIMKNSFHQILHFDEIKNIEIQGNILFKGNSGGGLRGTNFFYASIHSKIIFYNNTVQDNYFFFLKGNPSRQVFPPLISNMVRIEFMNCLMTFKKNTAVKGGIFMLEKTMVWVFDTDLIFLNNTSLLLDDLQHGIQSAIMLIEGLQMQIHDSKIIFSYNVAALSGGLTLINSTVKIKNINATFEHNEGGDGGAIAMYRRAVIEEAIWIHSCDSSECGNHDCRCMPGSVIGFYHNRALRRGGAVYVEDPDYSNSVTHIHKEHFYTCNQRLHGKNKILFERNSAMLAGNEIYGGWIDYLPICETYVYELQWTPWPKGDHGITSNPTRICVCINSIPWCNITEYHEEIIPGQSFKLQAVAVGQREGVVPSIVITTFSDKNGNLGEGQNVQRVNRECTTLNFTVFSKQTLVTVTLKVQNVITPDYKCKAYHLPIVLFQEFSVNIGLKTCPLGFLFNDTFKKCICLNSIQAKSGLNCDTEHYYIVRAKHMWLAAVFEHNVSQHHGIIVHDQCPFDYCRTDSEFLSFKLEFPNDQCSFHRSGIICGACQHNLSQVLGTSNCMNCSNIMILAIIPATIMAGILLVAFLMFFNLTVSRGTINGLIFYANIIRASQGVFFPTEINKSFLTIFIAWLNLDLGIETCFYNGLDAYIKTWLQFAFPIYIWLIVIIIIVASHYSTTVSKLTPRNALQVLATLFLLSYAKILRLAITVFSSTDLQYPDGFRRRIWLYDGNIEFLNRKHIPLFIVTLLVFTFLSVPYTFSLVSIQWLQRFSQYYLLIWVNRLMPLFDAYTGPYKHQHRYWTGLLLLVRVTIFTVFSSNQANDPSINLLTILIAATILLVFASFVGVYKSWKINILEIVFLLNLGFLSGATFYRLLRNDSLVLTTTISVSIAFIVFILITMNHFVRQLMSLRKMKNLNSYIVSHIANHFQMEHKEVTTDINNNIIAMKDITHTSVELKELLLDNESQ